MNRCFYSTSLIFYCRYCQCSMAITKNVAHFYNRISGECTYASSRCFTELNTMSRKFPRFSFLSKNTPFKKLKRKLSNALESFLYNCATRNQQAILLSAIACRCPSDKLFGSAYVFIFAFFGIAVEELVDSFFIIFVPSTIFWVEELYSPEL